MATQYFKQNSGSCIVTSLANLLIEFGERIPKSKVAKLEKIEEFEILNNLVTTVEALTKNYKPEVYTTTAFYYTLRESVTTYKHEAWHLRKLIEPNKSCLLLVSYASERHMITYVRKTEAGRIVIIDPLAGRKNALTEAGFFKRYDLNAVIYLDRET